MTKPLTLCLLALTLSSCASVKSKQKLVKRGINTIAAKNYWEPGHEYSFTISGNVSSLQKDSLKYISRKEIKMRLRSRTFSCTSTGYYD